MKIKRITLILSLILTCQLAFGHVGGHHQHKQDLKTFHLLNGVEITGSYSLTKDGKAFIELKNHKIAEVNLTDLIAADRLYVESRTKKIEKLNGVVDHSSNYNVAIVQIEQPKSFYSSDIPPYVYVIVGLLILGLIATFKLYRIGVWKKVFLSCLTLTCCCVLLTSCSKSITGCTDPTAKNYNSEADEDNGTCEYEVTPSSGSSSFTYSSIPNANVVADMTAAFAPYTSHVTTSNSGTKFYIEADAIASHEMMKGITAWIDQFPVYSKMNGANSWELPIQPTYSSDGYDIVGHFRKYAIGVAANGIAIFNPYNASGLISKDLGELDEYGGHAGTGDDYHYHTAPMHLENVSTPTIIAYALDGFPVYGNLEPDGSAMQALDPVYNGHEINGSFHYHGSTSFPFMVNTVRGTVQVQDLAMAPQDQIIPQPSTQNFRGNPKGLTGGASSTLIDSCIANGTNNGYTLYYTINGNQNRFVEYSWVAGATDVITFNFYNGPGNLDETQVWNR